MNNKENRTEKINIRITPEQKLAIEQTAEELKQSFSECIRNMMFPDNPQTVNPIVFEVQKKLNLNHIINLMNLSGCPSKYKNLILKELREGNSWIH